MKNSERQKIIDKLCQYDVYLIMKNINDDDYSWLADIREHGFKGYKNYTDKELLEEWEESKDGYDSMIADDEQLYNVVQTNNKIKRN
jgi:uncharacterized protein YfbU (UPF0304 family)